MELSGTSTPRNAGGVVGEQQSYQGSTWEKSV